MEKIVKNNEVELWSQSFGAESGEAILLIAGAGAPSVFWPDFFCKELAKLGYFVLRYDHRDIGYSTHFPVAVHNDITDANNVAHGLYDIFALVDDALAILDSYGIAKAHIVGHSMGGYIAELLALKHPKRVSSATIMSAGPLPTYEKHKLPAVNQKTWDILLSNKPTGDFDKDWSGWLRSWSYLNGKLAFDKDMAMQYTWALYTRGQGDYEIAYNHIAAVQSLPIIHSEELKEIKVPILVIHGEDDKLQPKANGELLARLIPGARLGLMTRSGHMFFNAKVWGRILRLILARII